MMKLQMETAEGFSVFVSHKHNSVKVEVLRDGIPDVVLVLSDHEALLLAVNLIKDQRPIDPSRPLRTPPER